MEFVWCLSIGSKIIIHDLDMIKVERVSETFSRIGVYHSIGPVPISKDQAKELRENPLYKPEQLQNWANLVGQSKYLNRGTE